MLESAHLYKGMTLWENLRFFAGLHGLDDNDALERSSYLLHTLDIWEGRDLPVESLSTGALRRASLARALMHSPRILLVDEPAGGLDQESLEAIRSLLEQVGREEGVTLFLCSSNMGFAQLVCRQYAVLKEGVLLARGDLEALRKGAGVGFRAQFRLGDGASLPGFRQAGAFWEREIETEEEMPQLIAQAVEGGAPLFEARLERPGLREIYAAWMEGGRRKAGERYEEEPEAADGEPPEGIEGAGADPAPSPGEEGDTAPGEEV